MELMIALAIGAALIAGMIQIFTSNNAAFRTQQTVSRMQENARFGFHFLTTELRQVGYRGCSGSTDAKNLLDTSSSDDEFLFDFDASLRGWAEEDLPNELDFGTTTPEEDSDVVLIRRAGVLSVDMQDGQPTNDASAIKVNTGHSIEDGDILTISDCLDSAIFQVDSASSGSEDLDVGTSSGDPGNDNTDLGNTFSDSSHISKTFVTVFYVAENPQGVPALYRMVNKEPPEELVAGVERIALEYGLDTDKTFDIPSPPPSDPDCDVDERGDDDVDTFEVAADIDAQQCEWDQVVGARLSILMRSQSDQVMEEQQTVRFAGEDLDFDDGHLRQVVNTTIAFRNKLR